MKIAIESNDGVTIKSPFLPTRGYVVYDINESDIVSSEYRESGFKVKNDSRRGDNPLAKTQALLNDCTAVITRGMDRNNLDVLKKEGMDVFVTFKTSAKDAVRLYMREQLISNKFAH